MSALSPLELLAVTIAAVAAGVVNALAGGGTLITFPVLTAVGIPSLAANITNTVALCPGHIGATLAQKEGLRGQRALLWWILPAGLVGGIVGGALLLNTGERTFRQVVPFLLLASSLLLASQDRVRSLLLSRSTHDGGHARWAPLLVGIAAIYGGYFGAGLGVVLLASLGIVLDQPLPRLNALKQAVALVVNVAAAVFFVFSDQIDWTVASAMAVGALAGGAIGGRLAARIDSGILRRAMVLIGLVLAIVYFVPGCSPQQPSRTKARAARSVRRSEALPPVNPSSIPWGEHTVESRLAEFGSRSRARWRPFFQAAGVSYPPAFVTLAAFKRERRIDVYAGTSPWDLTLLRRLPMTAASGGPGPKLREGDRQVPEGFYEIDLLNPNSLYHVALHVAYPNAFDERMAEHDRRRNLGGQIMIHGDAVSIGCIAVGDQGAEDLFTLAADSGLTRVSVLIAPRDFRRTGEHETLPGQPPWVRGLYADLDQRLSLLPMDAPVRVGTASRTPRAGTRRR